MRILYDNSIFSLQSFGGISRYFVELMSNCGLEFEWILGVKYSNNRHLLEKKRYFDVAAISPGPRGPRDISAKVTGILGTVRRRLMANPGIDGEVENIRYAKSLMAKGDWDVFHPTYYWNFLEDLKEGKRFVLTVHDTIHELYPEFFPLGEEMTSIKKRLILSAAHIVAVSQRTKEDVVSVFGVPSSKVTVIPLASSLSGYGTQQSGIEPVIPERYVLYTGLRSGYKNFYFFLNVISEFLRKENDLYLVCTGSSFNKEELGLVEKLGIEKKTIHMSVDDMGLTSLYKNAQFFAFPSLYEGFGMPVLEAFSCGCPVLLSESGALPEVGGDAAVYFGPKDWASLREKIALLLRDADLRSMLKLRGYRRNMGFSWEETAKRTGEVYARVASG